jgi:hypothetical protein
VAGLTAHAREAVREDAAPQVRRKLTFDVTRQPAAVGVGLAQLGEQRLRVPGNETLRDVLIRPMLGEAPARLDVTSVAELARCLDRRDVVDNVANLIQRVDTVRVRAAGNYPWLS